MRLGLFGGSFNPVHVGHLRMVVEVREALGLSRVELIPTATPPHKQGERMLPYELRVAMAEAATLRHKGLTVSEIEAVLPAPSYTCRTLAAYARIAPEAELHFIMGMGDLLDLPKWHRGRELPDLAHLAVAPRWNKGLADFRAFVPGFWPDARQMDEPPEGCACAWRLPTGGLIQYVEATRLDVSATDIRRRWLEGRSLAWLLPPEAEALMNRSWPAVRRAWSGVEEREPS